jgi:hypothetical protein
MLKWLIVIGLRNLRFIGLCNQFGLRRYLFCFFLRRLWLGGLDLLYLLNGLGWLKRLNCRRRLFWDHFCFCRDNLFFLGGLYESLVKRHVYYRFLLLNHYFLRDLFTLLGLRRNQRLLLLFCGILWFGRSLNRYLLLLRRFIFGWILHFFGRCTVLSPKL